MVYGGSVYVQNKPQRSTRVEAALFTLIILLGVLTAAVVIIPALVS